MGQRLALGGGCVWGLTGANGSQPGHPRKRGGGRTSRQQG